MIVLFLHNSKLSFDWLWMSSRFPSKLFLISLSSSPTTTLFIAICSLISIKANHASFVATTDQTKFPILTYSLRVMQLRSSWNVCTSNSFFFIHNCLYFLHNSWGFYLCSHSYNLRFYWLIFFSLTFLCFSYFDFNFLPIVFLSFLVSCKPRFFLKLVYRF